MGVDRELLRASYDANASNRAVRPLPEWRVRARDLWIDEVRAAGLTSVVDLGGATGTDGLAFADAGLDVTIVDLSPAHIEMAAEAGLNGVVADVTDTQLPDHAFGAAWSASTFMHLPAGEFETALAEVARIVQPGGLVRLGMWGGVDEEVVWEDDFQHPPRTFVHRSDEQVRRCVAHALDVVGFCTEQSGYRPDLHYQWVDARCPPAWRNVRARLRRATPDVPMASAATDCRGSQRS